ncbi:MAG: hypothetical protein E6Z55_05940 [Peptoniphilus harei]|nr:hypothetical protein [Peptoniphilus harei]
MEDRNGAKYFNRCLVFFYHSGAMATCTNQEREDKERVSRVERGE